MKEKSELKHYSKEAGLVFLGAILASVPLLMTNYMQTRAQQRQLIMDRRITALRDYSSSYNKLASDILPSIDELDEILAVAVRKHAKGSLTQQDVIQLRKQVDTVVNKHRSWFAEINTQIAIINPLFKVNLTPRTLGEVSSSADEDEMDEECLKCLKDTITSLRSSTIQSFNDHQQIVGELGARLMSD